ncbi:MAG TPA: hypothetical protein GX687_02555, partial [Clostridia bacterium]|nr:hypothetical protein [Clostridia bacterium]
MDKYEKGRAWGEWASFRQKLGKLISTEHSLRREFEKEKQQAESYVEKAIDEYQWRNQGLRKRTTNFLLRANVSKKYSLEELLQEVEAQSGYSPKYEEYVRKTGYLITEVEEARNEALIRLVNQEKVRKEKILDDAVAEILNEENKTAKLEELLFEEHLHRGAYEKTKNNTKNYIAEALAYHRTYVLTGKVKLGKKGRLGRIFRRKQPVLTPPSYVLNEYIYEARNQKGYSGRYAEHLRATGKRIPEVEEVIRGELEKAKLMESKRRKAYLQKEGKELFNLVEEEIIKNEKLEHLLEMECEERNQYQELLERNQTYLAKALKDHQADTFPEETLALHEHVTRYSLQEYFEEIAENHGYSPKYEEYVRVTGRQNQKVEVEIEAELKSLKEMEKIRKDKIHVDLLAEFGQGDLRKKIVINNFIEKERSLRNNYAAERKKLAAYLSRLQHVPQKGQANTPLYSRDEYLAEIYKNNGYSPKYLEDLQRVGRKNNDPLIEMIIMEAVENQVVQEDYRRKHWVRDLNAAVKETDPYVIKLEEMLDNEYSKRNKFEVEITETKDYVNRALQNHFLGRQGLRKRTSSFILGKNLPPEYTMDEYWDELNTSGGYSAKYEEYVQKTGKLIPEIEKKRQEIIQATSEMESLRQAEEIKKAARELLITDQVQTAKLADLLNEEYRLCSNYESQKAITNTYVDDALAYNRVYVLSGKIKTHPEQSRIKRVLRRKEQVLTPPDYLLSDYLYEVKKNQGYSEKYAEYLRATGKKIPDVEVAINKELNRLEKVEAERRQVFIEQNAETWQEFSNEIKSANLELENSFAADFEKRVHYQQELQ